MPTPDKHALLSASSAARWLHCTAAPRFEATFEATSSEYAEEGRLAHAVCELKLRAKFCDHPRGAYLAEMSALRKSAYWCDEMDTLSDRYVQHLLERSLDYAAPPNVTPEVQVDYSSYAPEGFGTCDCVMIGGDLLDITDYKHGVGVPVSAVGNPQMRLYALGALTLYAPIYGGAIKRVRMTIEQLRLSDEPQSEILTVDELLAWGESVKPIAAVAFAGAEGGAVYKPGAYCQFCRGAARCRARAEQAMSAEPDALAHPDPNTLTDAEVGDLLTRGELLTAWYHKLQDHALQTALTGGDIPGYKVVEGRSVRALSDIPGALDALQHAGFDRALLYDSKPKALTALESMVGKSKFATLCGPYICKPAGKPALVPASDPRPAYNAAAADFAAVVKSTNNV